MRLFPSRIFRYSALSFLFLLSTGITYAQGGEESSCTSRNIVSVPSRPTVTSATDTTQCGVAELEYGLERQWTGADAHRDDLTGGLRFGVIPNLDLHWASSDFLTLWNLGDTRTGFGDTWLGARYRYLTQSKIRPSLGVSYQAKVPSADAARGFGSGQVDHSVAFLVSKDVGKIHLDFNVIPTLAGRAVGSGYDHSVGLALSGSRPLTRRLALVAEPYGYTALNAESPAFASLMVGMTYQVNRRLILDGGIDGGLTHYAPEKRVYVGMTCAVANLYAWLKPAY